MGNSSARSVASSPVGRYVGGVRLLFRGLGLYARTPRMLVLGLLPGALTAVLFLLLLGLLIRFLPDLAAVVTWFAADWDPGARSAIQVLAAIGLLAGAGLISVLSFTAVATFLGDPFYERISHWVEEQCGGVAHEVEIGFWRGLRQSLADSLRLLLVTVPIGIMIFVGGFVPVLGQTLIPVVGATVGGWFLAVNLVGTAFTRRGLRLSERRRRLRANRPAALGFGTAVFVCFLIPGGAILMMPAAVAGGTLLARHVLGDPIRDPARAS